MIEYVLDATSFQGQETKEVQYISVKKVLLRLLNSSFNLKKCLSNVLITGESKFDERNVQEMFN